MNLKLTRKEINIRINLAIAQNIFREHNVEGKTLKLKLLKKRPKDSKKKKTNIINLID